MRSASERLVPAVFLGLVPVAAVLLMFLVAFRSDSIALDFHNEIYPQAEALLAGELQYPRPDADLSRGSNHVWPPLVGIVAAPLTFMPIEYADVFAAVGSLLAFFAALWIVGARDWRLYGAAALWAPVLAEIRTAHLTLVLSLLVALGWRLRTKKWASGLVIGGAIGLKFFLWPLALWLAALRRYREAALALTVTCLSLALVLPYLSLVDYARVLDRLGETFDQDSYSLYGLLLQLDVPETTGRVTAAITGLVALAAAWRRRSLVLSVAAALLLSPIVWLDYYALLAIPLAVVSPTFSWPWLLPLLTWGLPDAGLGIGDPLNTIRVLAVFAVITWYIVPRESSTRTQRDVVMSADRADLNAVSGPNAPPHSPPA